jgi:NAD(P)-dependent dehydrogenase (short-subunit alcohol dehydrogenase family)
MGKLDGKVAILTGGSEGIGMTYAHALAAEGASVAIWDVVSTDKIVAEVRAKGGKCIGMTCDVTDARAVSQSLSAVIAEFGGVHILVNNAAVFARLLDLKPFEDITSVEFDKAMSVNVRGPFECAKAVSPIFRKQNYGKIINIASGTAFKGTAGLMHYVASKGAVISLTRAMANELGNAGVRCNAIAPGLVLTEAIARPGLEDFRAGAVATRFLKTGQMPQDLAGALVFLASPDSDFITGQTLVVDGGSAMH